MKRNAIINFLKWILITVYIVASLSFARDASRKVVCNQIDVYIEDSLSNAFITKKDVVKLIEKKGESPKGKPLHEINTLKLEEKIAQFNTVKQVDAYKTINGRLAVRITQRRPIARVINREQLSYYFDEEGKIFPWSSRYTSHVLVINGNINEPFPITNNLNLMQWRPDSSTDTVLFIYKLYEFAQFITSNRFWNAQIAQVYVANTNSIELIPRVGGHIIQLGSLDEYPEKMEKLRIFYEKALPYEGWNKYKKINLKYKNQVVCTKR